MSIHEYIHDEVRAERAYQQRKWAGTDEQNTPYHWAAFINCYATRHLIGDVNTVDLDAFRADMVKVAALAVAAIEQLDNP